MVTWINDRGGSGTCTGTTSWSQADITLYSGSNVITVTSYDAANNSSTDVITVTYTPADTTAPVVTITSPTASATYETNASTMDISGTASDAVGVSLVTWHNDRYGTGILSCTGTTSWSKTASLLFPGVNVITITAWDAAGNSSTDVLTVTYTAPTIDSDFSSSESIGRLPYTVQFQNISTNLTEDTTYEWTFGDGSTSTYQNPTHIYTTTGKFEVILKCTNSLGDNTETKSDYITVDAPGGSNVTVGGGGTIQ